METTLEQHCPQQLEEEEEQQQQHDDNNNTSTMQDTLPIHNEPATVSSNKENHGEETTSSSVLTRRRQVCNLASLVFAYACVISSTTLVVGTSAVIVLSVGGNSRQSPIALAMFFVGSACISLATSQMFIKLGQLVGFLVGVALGLFGALLGMIAILTSSPTLVILASLPLGASNGIGFYLRFAAVDVVPAQYFKSLAVTLVLSGGVLAAFVGPETAQATKDIFGDDLTYLGTYMMIGIFNVLNACFTLAVQFPPPAHEHDDKDTTTLVQEQTTSSRSIPIDKNSSNHDTVTLFSLLYSWTFFVSCAMATASWCIMAMPMSIVRVAMGELGFTFRQSLTTIELHFVGMYGPGFITGTIINHLGAYKTSLLAIACFLIATIINLFSESSQAGSLATWILGLCIVGIGWNLGFSSATVLLTQVYHAHPNFKTRIQAANDFGMFFISGGTTFATGYIYNAGGGMLQGWKTVNYVVLSMIAIIACIMIPACIHETRRIQESALKRLETRTSANMSNDSVQDVIAMNDGIRQEETGFELAYDFKSIHASV